MYLSKLTLDLRSREARRDLGDVYEMHRTLSRAFAAGAHSVPARFLWRLEKGRHDALPNVLVQSAERAEWSPVRSLKHYLSEDVRFNQNEHFNKHVPLDDFVEEGRRYRFRLLANPTVTRQGKRYGLIGAAEQLAWLARQGERHGFALEDVCVSASDLLASRKGDATLQVHRTCFDGVLRATCASDLRTAVRGGIGPAKAFGCGMLSVAPG